ncbi:MAG: DMT family transporter [Eubacteriaceae bacterium]|nr:DMT family transporter [Eubacteriaceae bacterium]
MKNKSEWLVVAGAVCWSLNAPFVKSMEMDTMLVCAMRSLIAGICLSPFIFQFKLHFSKSLISYIICYTGNTICLILALKLVPTAIAVGMQYTAMIWLFIIAVIQQKSSLNARSILPVAVVVMGVLLFMLSGRGGAYSAAGMIMAASESFFFAGLSYFSKGAAGDNPLGLTSASNLVTAAFMFTFLHVHITAVAGIGMHNWLLLLFLGIVQLGGGYSLYNAGLKHVAPQKSSMLALWEMILGPIWCVIFLHEIPTIMVIAGFAMILCGMLLDGMFSLSSEDRMRRAA